MLYMYICTIVPYYHRTSQCHTRYPALGHPGSVAPGWEKFRTGVGEMLESRRCYQVVLIYRHSIKVRWEISFFEN